MLSSPTEMRFRLLKAVHFLSVHPLHRGYLHGKQIVGQREKGEEEELGWDLHPREGGLKEEKFPHPGNLLHWLGVMPGQIRSFRGLRGECRSWPAAPQGRERPV